MSVMRATGPLPSGANELKRAEAATPV